jgi:C-terminal processing protease CtpA/Prc
VAGPAHKSEMIAEGDVLYMIDGACMFRATFEDVSAMLLGPESSVCYLTLIRGEQRLSATLIRRTIATQPEVTPSPFETEL